MKTLNKEFYTIKRNKNYECNNQLKTLSHVFVMKQGDTFIDFDWVKELYELNGWVSFNLIVHTVYQNKRYGYNQSVYRKLLVKLSTSVHAFECAITSNDGIKEEEDERYRIGFEDYFKQIANEYKWKVNYETAYNGWSSIEAIIKEERKEVRRQTDEFIIELERDFPKYYEQLMRDNDVMVRFPFYENDEPLEIEFSLYATREGELGLSYDVDTYSQRIIAETFEELFKTKQMNLQPVSVEVELFCLSTLIDGTLKRRDRDMFVAFTSEI